MLGEVSGKIGPRREPGIVLNLQNIVGDEPIAGGREKQAEREQ
jgi:hypothetical protein